MKATTGVINHDPPIRGTMTVPDMMKARKAILEDTKHERGQNVRGEIPCPVCSKGKLSFEICGYNGHIQGHCTTPGCVRWCE